MSSNKALSTTVRARFFEAFGQPHASIGNDDHWVLQPAPDRGSINLLLKSDLSASSVWVFDPHDPVDGVLETAIDHEDQADRVIQQIRDRVSRVVQQVRDL